MQRGRIFKLTGWGVTALVTLFMLRDIATDLQQSPWAIQANAGLGIPANIVLPIGLSGLAATLLYAFPRTAVLGAILLTGFFGGACVIHLRIHGAADDIAENVMLGVLAWSGLWLRDPHLRRLLPFRRG